MPIFHDPQDSPPRHLSSRQASSAGKQRAGASTIGFDKPLSNITQSEDRTDCESQIDMQPPSPKEDRKPSRLDRIELIERLKRTQSPSWQLQNVSSVRISIRQDFLSTSQVIGYLTRRCRTSTPPSEIQSPSDHPEIDQRPLCFLLPMSHRHARPLQIHCAILPPKVYRLSDPDLPYIRETLGKRERIMILEVCQRQRHFWRRRL
jgi:hypothetical protein